MEMVDFLFYGASQVILPLILCMSCIAFIDVHTLSHLYIPGKSLSSGMVWCMIFIK